MAATPKLWFPGSLAVSFTQVPWLEGLCEWPVYVDWILSGLLCCCWVALVVYPTRVGNVGAISFGCLLIALNQHRLQPWHYQFLIFAFVFAALKSSRPESWGLQLKWLRWLTISIYFYSAVSKADFEFLHTVGQQFLDQILEVGNLQSKVPNGWRIPLASLMPLVELIVAVGLLARQTRRIAGIAACCLHLGLIILLGPLGLGHSLGVVLWNVHFVVLSLMLFVWKEHVDAPDESRTGGDYLRVVLLSAIVFPVIALPLLERFGWWDHWPSWALYAPHSSRVEVFVARSVTDSLPPQFKQYMPPASEGQIWVRVPMGDSSLGNLGVPVYPQARFQIGVARFLAGELDSEFEIRVDVLGPASRFSGKRMVQRLEGRTEVEKAADSFWFNTKPRREFHESNR